MDTNTNPTNVLDVNHHILSHLKVRKDLLRKDQRLILPWLVPCRAKVLLVTDGALDFGLGDFGLSAFIDCLQNDGRFYVKFDITLAHLRDNVSSAQMGNHASGIVNRYTGFRFDNPSQFSDTMYDQVWLFGFETSYHQSGYSFRNSNRSTYPAGQLGEQELRNLSSFMKKKGGVFATGDHGRIGAALCGSIIRVRSMRLWNSTSSNNNLDEVSMTGSRRNDTNQVGHDAGTQFSDQSDDVPQTITLTPYYNRIGRFIEVSYPHPLLCSRLGKIDVLPDHPHEGECIAPSDVDNTYFDGNTEYPLSSTGFRVVPEVIAESSVRAGNTATLNGSKSPTLAHTFGAISAYDGHRANVGRVVTDATWHHFVNVNLIGLVEGGLFDDLSVSSSSDDTKHDGFLSTNAGKAHFAKIKEYFVNIGVWISPPGLIDCFNSKMLIKLVYNDRIMEAALTDPNVHFDKISTSLFYSIGLHAWDVLGRATTKCQSVQWLRDIIVSYIPELIPKWDPWFPEKDDKFVSEVPMPWFDLSPIFMVMLGAGLVAVRQEMPYPSDKIDDKKFMALSTKVLRSAAIKGMQMAVDHYTKEGKVYNELLSVAKKVKR